MSRLTIHQSSGWKLLSVVALVVVSALAWTPSVHAAQVINLITPVSGITINGCPGSEPIQLSGESHEVIALSESGDLQHYSLNWQGVKAVGLVTGTTYEINFRIEFSSPTSGRETTALYHGISVGPGPDNNDLFRAQFHMTVNPDGTVTAYFNDFSENCTQ